MDTRSSGAAEDFGTKLLQPRIPQRLLDALLLVAGISASAELVAALVVGEFYSGLWTATGVASLLVATAVLRRQPGNPIGVWFALMAGCSVVAQALDTALIFLREQPAGGVAPAGGGGLEPVSRPHTTLPRSAGRGAGYVRPPEQPRQTSAKGLRVCSPGIP